MDHLYKTKKAMNITSEHLFFAILYLFSPILLVRQDVCQSLFKMHTWGILPSKDQVESVAMFFQSNFKAGVKERVMYTQVRSIICLANSQPTPDNAQRFAP